MAGLAGRVSVVLAGDAPFFHQTRAAIESIRRADPTFDVRYIAIGPSPREQLEWLDQLQVIVFDKIDGIPRFNGAPLHAVALTCRPFLPELFPDAQGFIWMDSDVRILDREGLDVWSELASEPECPIA